MILSLIIFFAITIASFISIIGYGNLLLNYSSKNIWLQNSVYFFIGLIFLNLIGLFLYYFNLNNSLINLIILFVGLFFFKYKINKKLIFKYLILHFFLFSGLLISKLHEDWSYHFNFIEQIVNHSPIIGIGNVDDIHVLSTSFFSFVQKIFYLPYFEFSFVFVPVYLIYLNIVAVLIFLILSQKKKALIIFSMIFALIIIKFSRFSEFGYDYVSNFILIYLIILFTLSKIEKFEFQYISQISIILFLYASSIKLSSILFLPIIIYIIYEEIKNKKIYNFYKIHFFSAIFLFLFILENFLRSGCLFYFLEFTCFNQDFISWKIDYQRVVDHSLHVKLWAKGFYHQDLILNVDEYLKFSNWMQNWLDIHFFYKVLEFLAIPLIFISISIFSEKFKIKNKNNILFLIFCLVSFLLWFSLIPQLRFGTAVIIALCTSIITLFSNIDESLNIKKQKIVIFIIFALLIFNFKNINRINDEINREDNYKFINFPFPPENRLQSNKINEENIKYKLYKGKKFKKIMWFKVTY